MDLNFKKVPFEEAIAYLRDKVPMPTSAWDELWGEIQDTAFSVAGITSADILNDLHQAVIRAEEDGTTLDEFKRSVKESIATRGVPTPLTNARMNLVFDQNLASAHGAGRKLQLDELKPDYVMWRHRDSRVPRPAHLALNNKVFRRDELPGYPPCGFGCRCAVFGLSDRDLKERKLSLSDPITQTVTAKDRITGKKFKLPAIEVDGELHPIVEPGFHGDRGVKSPEQRQKILQQGLDRLPPVLRELAKSAIEARTGKDG